MSNKNRVNIFCILSVYCFTVVVYLMVVIVVSLRYQITVAELHLRDRDNCTSHLRDPLAMPEKAENNLLQPQMSKYNYITIIFTF